MAFGAPLDGGAHGEAKCRGWVRGGATYPSQALGVHVLVFGVAQHDRSDQLLCVRPCSVLRGFHYKGDRAEIRRGWHVSKEVPVHFSTPAACRMLRELRSSILLARPRPRSIDPADMPAPSCRTAVTDIFSLFLPVAKALCPRASLGCELCCCLLCALF